MYIYRVVLLFLCIVLSLTAIYSINQVSFQSLCTFTDMVRSGINYGKNGYRKITL